MSVSPGTTFWRNLKHQQTAGLGHSLDLQHTGHHRLGGKVPLEEGFVRGHVLDCHHIVAAHVDYLVN